MTATYNEVNENGDIVKKNEKAPTFYAVGDIYDKVKSIENIVTERLSGDA